MKCEVNFYKVGRTIRPKSAKERVEEWVIISGEPYSLLGQFETQYPIYLEYMAHEWLKNERRVYTDPKNIKKRIEWFKEVYEKVESVINKILSFLETLHN